LPHQNEAKYNPNFDATPTGCRGMRKYFIEGNQIHFKYIFQAISS
jgi:hypothetical protein